MRRPSPELRVIFHEEFRRQIRRGGSIGVTVALSVLMLIAIPLTSFVVDLIEEDSPDQTVDVGENPLATVGYVDPAGALPGPRSQDSPRLYGDRAAGIQAVLQGDIDALFILPADYLESGEVESYRPPGDDRTAFWGSPAEWAFGDFLRAQLVAGQVEPDRLARVLWPADYVTFKIGDDGAVTEEITTTQEVGEFLVPMLFGVLLMIAVLTGSGILLRSVYEEKETRMIELLVTGASPLSIMTGKLLALWSAGLIQIAVWITVGAFAIPAIFDRIPGGQELTISPGLLTTVSLSFVLGYFLFSVLALFMAAVINSQKSANQQTGLLSLLIGLPVWLIGLFMNQPDGAIAEILTWFPFSAPTMLMVRLGAGGDMSGGKIAAVLLMVATTALLLLWIAARVFRAGILLAGQRVTPGNVWTALRYAD